jgi:amino acid transporter
VYLLSGSSSAASTFTVVLYLATSTTLLSYLVIFPAAIKLRMSHSHVPRPYRLGRSGDGLMWLCTGLCTLWMVLGSWVALFPGTLESITGHSYSVMDSYGVTRLRFEVFTLGTLGVILVIGLIGYVLAADVRAKAVQVPLATSGLEPSSGD